MVLSTTGNVSRQKARAAINDVTNTLAARGLRVHRTKTRIITPGARKIVLGLLVDGKRPRLLPEFKRRLELHVRGVGTFGLSQHADHRGSASILSMINHVDGCIAFAMGVERSWSDALPARWTDALRASGYPRPDGEYAGFSRFR